MIKKILNTRLWPDADGRGWKKSLKAEELEVIVGARVLQDNFACMLDSHLSRCSRSVSQFTLYAKLNGNKPEFRAAMPPDQAREFYNTFMDELRATYVAERVHSTLALGPV